VLVPWWYPPDGSEPIPLNPDGTAWLSLDSWSGVTGAAPVQVVTDPHPRGGARVRHVQPQPRMIVWPLRFRARSHMDLVRSWRHVASKFTQTRRLGPGRLRIVRPDGTAREILAWYDGGFDGLPGQGWVHDTAVVSLLCEDPYWRDTIIQRVTRSYIDQSSVNFYDSFMTIASGRVLGETTITNPGDVEAWPTWEITGPASLVTATNHTTGEAFILDPDWAGGGDLSVGETVTITTDPPTVRGPADAVWTGALNWPNATLWGLVPGVNHVEFQVDGADTGTSVTLSWQTRHETP
jgi:Phage tail protein.